MSLTLVIMAAGVGSRYGGVKQLDSVGPSGETLMDYSIHDAIQSGFTEVVFIIRKELQEAFNRHYQERFRGRIEIKYVYQDEFKKHEQGFLISRSKPWGTGHAMLAAMELVNTPFAILNADDFYGPSAFETMGKALSQSDKNRMIYLVGYKVSNTLSEYGTVSRAWCRMDRDDHLEQITELTKISRNNDRIVFEENNSFHPLDPDDIVSMNFWGFFPEIHSELDHQFKLFIEKKHDDPKAEFYIPTFVDLMIRSGYARVKVLRTNESWLGVTYREDRPRVTEGIKRLVDQGIYPSKVG